MKYTTSKAPTSNLTVTKRILYVRLGRSEPDLKVARIILGTLIVTSWPRHAWIHPLCPHTCDCLTYAIHGVNAFDTANAYSNGLSEVYLGSAIKALSLSRGEIVVVSRDEGV